VPRTAGPTGYVPVMTDEHLSTPEVPASLIPAEDDEGPQTAEASRAKADPDSPTSPGADASDDEFTDPSAQPPA
jgi:hypothetical protein